MGHRPQRRASDKRQSAIKHVRSGPRPGAEASTATAILRLSVLAAATGAFAVGAGAVGALAISRLAVDRAILKDVKIGTLDIERLRVHHREDPAER